VQDNSGDLEKAIDAITKSYNGPDAINNLKSAALPNRRAVIDAFEHIAPMIYMGFYATRPLSQENLRYSVSEHAYPAYEQLCQQISRAITYEQNCERMMQKGDEFAHRATMKLFCCMPELRKMLNEDVVAAFSNDPAARSVEEVIFSYPTLEAITAYRVAHILYKAGVPMIPRIISEYAHSRTGIDIHPAAIVGRRLFIDHGTGVVIGETAQLGDDVKLYQGVTLGALSTKRVPHHNNSRCEKRHPTLENNVTIYAGATILGGETTIGEGSIIGGNMWLVRSVPPHSKIFGGPRTETKEDET